MALASRPLVMVADDDPSIRRLLEDCLREEGFLCAAYPDGLALVNALATIRPSAILVDVRMPRLDGFGVMAHLRADPRLAVVPVVAISAEPGSVDIFAAGCRAFVAKPFDLGELVGAVRTVLA